MVVISCLLADPRAFKFKDYLTLSQVEVLAGNLLYNRVSNCRNSNWLLSIIRVGGQKFVFFVVLLFWILITLVVQAHVVLSVLVILAAITYTIRFLSIIVVELYQRRINGLNRSLWGVTTIVWLGRSRLVVGVFCSHATARFNFWTIRV